MKKLCTILLIAFAFSCKAQTGIVISGITYNNAADSITRTTLYSIPTYVYGGFDSMVTVSFPLARNAYAAKSNQIYTPLVPQYTFKSTIGYPTPTSLYNAVKIYLNSLGYTVTTF